MLDLWRRSLSQIPTLFGRLNFLASFHDPVAGRYSHPDLLRLMGPDDTDRTLCGSHHQVFTQWLSLSLADQRADLHEYLDSTGSPRFAQHYRPLVPPTARAVERQLFFTDLETLLDLLRFEPAASAIRAALPHPLLGR